MTPYSQGNGNFRVSAKQRADNIFNQYAFYKNVYCDDEIICTNFAKMKQKYSDKKIIIIGGGPSTNEFLENQDNYNNKLCDFDYIWSVNHFYLNPILKTIKVDLAMMMLEPNIFSEEFVEYYNSHKPTLGFELHNKWKSTVIPYDDCFVMQTRFYGILGACQRMIIFASLLGANTVSFIGLDGLSAIKKGKHSFQPGKKTMPSISDPNVYKRQYEIFWNYLFEFRNGTKFINLKRDRNDI